MVRYKILRSTEQYVIIFASILPHGYKPRTDGLNREVGTCLARAFGPSLPLTRCSLGAVRKHIEPGLMTGLMRVI